MEVGDEVEHKKEEWVVTIQEMVGNSVWFVETPGEYDIRDFKPFIEG